MNPYFLQHLPSKLRVPHKWRPLLIKYFPTAFSPPHMTPEEYSLLKKSTKFGKSVVEFGSGGSTFYFLSVGKIVTSIESDISFINYLKTFPLIKHNIYKGSLNLCHVNLGETGMWGVPKERSLIELWPQYYQSVWEKSNIQKPDILFIDGRFRVMCALYAINYISSDTVVIIHDFLERENYSVVLNFFDIVEKADTLVVLKLKRNINTDRLEAAKSEYQFDYR